MSPGPSRLSSERAHPARLASIGALVLAAWARPGLAGEALPEGCAQPATAAQVVDAAHAVEGAFAAMDPDTMGREEDRVRALLPCLREPLSSLDAVTLHRAAAWSAWIADDQDGARAALTAVRALQPAWAPPSTVAPEGNPLRELFEQALPGAAGAPLHLPAGAHALVDGSPRGELPADRLVVVQLVSDAGAVAWSGLLAPGDPPPPWSVPPPLPPPPETEAGVGGADLPVPPHRLRSTSLLAATVVAAVGSVTTYALAEQAANRYRTTGVDGAHDRTELDALRVRASRLATTSVGVGFVAGGLALTTALVWSW